VTADMDGVDTRDRGKSQRIDHCWRTGILDRIDKECPLTTGFDKNRYDAGVATLAQMRDIDAAFSENCRQPPSLRVVTDVSKRAGSHATTS